MKFTIEEVLEKYSFLIKKISNELTIEVNYLNIDLEDLYQVGCLALIESYHNYNPDKGSLTTFVHYVARYAMLDYINNNNYIMNVPINVSMAARLIARISYQYLQKYGKKITNSQLLEELSKYKTRSFGRKINSDFIREIEILNSYYFYPHINSLDEISQVKDFDGFSIIESLSDSVVSDYDMEKEVTDHVLFEQIIEYISQLDDESKFIIINRLGIDDDNPQTLRKIDETLGIGFQMVDYYYHKTLKKIRENLNISI